jgi:transposase
MKTVYRARDGKEFESEFGAKKHERELDGLVHACPHCSGMGYLTESFLVRSADPDIFLDRDEYENRRFTCCLCRGKAWRKTPWVPVYRQVVDHYTHAEDAPLALIRKG